MFIKTMAKKQTNILNLFESKDYLKVCAPMVRYSKLPFRTLMRHYSCDLCFTPMIMADSFCKSEKARINEFTTNLNDVPLITQFAANTVHDFVGAANIVAPYCDGIDLNCGCPQRWAKQMGLGCAMLKNPELIARIIKDCRNNIPKTLTVSVKLRILKDLRRCVDLCRQLEAAGVSFLSVHARTPSQLTGDINVDALRLINDSVACPVIANGGIKSLEDCNQLHAATGCKGIMVANTALANPEIFTGRSATSVDCVQKWLDICYNLTVPSNSYDLLSNAKCHIDERPPNLTFQCFHHHLVFMLEKLLPKEKRRVFNNLQRFKDVLEFIQNELDLTPRLYSIDEFVNNSMLDVNYEGRDELYLKLKENCCDDVISYDYDYDNSNGNYFTKKVSVDNFDEFNLNDIFPGCG